MERKDKLLLLVLSVILVVSVIVVFSNDNNPLQGKIRGGVYKPGISADADRAVNQAQKVYQEKKDLGVDFSTGPCLTNDLLPDWVLDIAHSPRISLDDLPANQCQAYLEKRAKHFVELDPNGVVLRVY